LRLAPLEYGSSRVNWWTPIYN